MLECDNSVSKKGADMALFGLRFFSSPRAGCHFVLSFLHALAREGDNSVLKKGADMALFYSF